MLCAHQSPYIHRPYTQTFTPPEKQTPLLGIEPAAPPPSWAPSQDVIPLRQSTTQNVFVKKLFREFTAQMPHPHNGRGVQYFLSSVVYRVELWLTSHSEDPSIRFQILGVSFPDLQTISFSIGSRYHTQWYLLGEPSV